MSNDIFGNVAGPGDWYLGLFRYDGEMKKIFMEGCSLGEPISPLEVATRQDTIDMVRDFHEAFGHPTNERPSVRSDCARERGMLVSFGLLLENMAKRMNEEAAVFKSRNLLRMQLLTEELAELAQALGHDDELGALDALTDLQYVLDGAYLTFGMDKIKLEAFEEVHDSNMSKLGPGGRPLLEESGRVIKGPSYHKPELQPILQAEKEKSDG